VLAEGDEVTVPAPKLTEVQKSTGQRHRFRRVGVPELLRIRLVDYLEELDDPRAGVSYLLELQRMNGQAIESREGKTDDKGFLKEPIPPDAARGTIRIKLDGETRAIAIELGRLAPATELTGVQRRLSNLAYYRGPEDGAMSDELQAAIEDFQLDYGLELTGEADEDTVELLSKLHLS
jgi:hypothetical protein